MRYSRRSLAQSRTKLPPDGQLKIFEDNLLARVGTTACVPRADDRKDHLFAAVHESAVGTNETHELSRRTSAQLMWSGPDPSNAL